MGGRGRAEAWPPPLCSCWAGKGVLSLPGCRYSSLECPELKQGYRPGGLNISLKGKKKHHPVPVSGQKPEVPPLFNIVKTWGRLWKGLQALWTLQKAIVTLDKLKTNNPPPYPAAAQWWRSCGCWFLGLKRESPFSCSWCVPTQTFGTPHTSVWEQKNLICYSDWSQVAY